MGIVNQTGSGPHRDSRREVRACRGGANRREVIEQLEDQEAIDSHEGFWLYTDEDFDKETK